MKNVQLYDGMYQQNERMKSAPRVGLKNRSLDEMLGWPFRKAKTSEWATVFLQW